MASSRRAIRTFFGIVHVASPTLKLSGLKRSTTILASAPVPRVALAKMSKVSSWVAAAAAVLVLLLVDLQNQESPGLGN